MQPIDRHRTNSFVIEIILACALRKGGPRQGRDCGHNIYEKKRSGRGSPALALDSAL